MHVCKNVHCACMFDCLFSYLFIQSNHNSSKKKIFGLISQTALWLSQDWAIHQLGHLSRVFNKQKVYTSLKKTNIAETSSSWLPQTSKNVWAGECVFTNS